MRLTMCLAAAFCCLLAGLAAADAQMGKRVALVGLDPLIREHTPPGHVEPSRLLLGVITFSAIYGSLRVRRQPVETYPPLAQPGHLCYAPAIMTFDARHCRSVALGAAAPGRARMR
jgi:hypothetical protein